MRAILFLSLLATLGVMAAAQEPDSAKAQRMQWFEDAKLGIFIHWGIYAVNGIDESWSFYNGYITYDDYMKQLAGFTAARYDPPAWARLISRPAPWQTVPQVSARAPGAPTRT